MLFDPRRLLVLVLLVTATVAASIAASSFDAAAALRTLPSFRSDEPYDVDVSSFSARGLVSGAAMLDINEARLERDALAALRGLAGSQPAGRAPRSLASLRGAAGASGVRRALDGIPRAELQLEAFVRQPDEPLDPWRVEVIVDVRPIAGDAPEFATPRSEAVVQVRPWGEPGSGVITRWHVERVTLERGGLLALARDVVYVRRGNVGVVAPAGDADVARDVAATVDGMQADVRRRYRGLSEGRSAFVALVPSRAHVRRVYDRGAMASDAIGTAYDDRHMAILLPSFLQDPSFAQRSLLRHELTHLATSRLTRAYGHSVYVEGVAEWEGNHEIVASGEYYVVNGPAVTAVESGKVDLDALLFEVDAFEDVDPVTGYRLGMLVADYIESEFGHAKAVRFYSLLGDGVAPRVAVRRALRTSPASFRDGVRGSMSANRSWFG